MSKTALVIDDSRSARFVLRKFLESHGYAVDTAESPQDAYFYLRRKHPDVVFLDHLMPGTDRFESLRVLRQDKALSEFPIVLCSPDESEPFVADACAQGAFDVLAKPPSSDELVAVLQRVEQLAATSRVPPRKVRTPLARTGPATTESDEGITSSAAATDRFEALSHMLYVQIAELRTQIAHLNAARLPEDEAGLKAPGQESLYARIDALGHQLEDALTAQNRVLMAAIQTHSQQIEAMGSLLQRTLNQDQNYQLSHN